MGKDNADIICDLRAEVGSQSLVIEKLEQQVSQRDDHVRRLTIKNDELAERVAQLILENKKLRMG